MAEVFAEVAEDRVIIRLDPGKPVELHDLSSSFAALARIYERHYRSEGDTAPRLYVTKLETGSYVLEIAPMAVILGAVVVMDGAVIVADFTNRVWRGIKAFSGSGSDVPRLEMPSKQDTADFKEFTRPLLGKKGAELGIRHARFQKDDGHSKTVVEYNFDEVELNRAAVNMDSQLALPPPEAPLAIEDKSGFHAEVMLFFEQANRGPGKEKGRTGDRGVIPDISDRVVPVYFKKSIQDIKDRMMHGQENPFSLVFVVTVHVTTLEGEVKAYTVTDIHDSFERDE
jgi:hypothetical protein